jgi:DNA-binding winged helix-turn-helix (wHTH) protein
MQVSFGDFVLDLDARELLRGSEPVRLSPKAFQLLQILVTNRPKALSKADLQDQLWPDTFVVEKNLANLISEIREALGEDPSDPRFIRTVPRYGYAFREPAANIDESRSGARPPTSVWRRAALALGVAALLAGGYAALALRGTRPTTPTGQIMLAVLPFQNLTGDPEQQYLCDGLTEEMIAHLGAVDPSRLGVIARTSAMHYKDTTKRADEIARELGVTYLLSPRDEPSADRQPRSRHGAAHRRAISGACLGGCRLLLGLGSGRTTLQASDGARPERRHDIAVLFFLPGVHGAARRGVARRRTSLPPGPRVPERSDEPWLGPAAGPATPRGRPAVRGDP